MIFYFSAAKSLNESAIMVEDDHVKALRLVTELSAAEEKLRCIKEQNDTLQRQLKDFEMECNAKAEELKTLKETTDADKIKTARDNATAIEAKRREIQELQRLVDQLRHEVREGKVEMIRENDVLRKEVVDLEHQSKREGEELDAMRKEVDAANTALRIYRGRSKVAIETAREENKQFKDRADDLWQQVGALEKHVKERDAQIRQLQQTGQSSDDELRTVQVMMDEKDRALSHCQCQLLALEKQKEDLLGKLARMETEVEETRNASQRLLARAKEEHKQEIVQANDRIRYLQGELDSYSADAEKLRSTIKVSNADAAKAVKLADDRTVEIERLQDQLGIVEEELHSKEQELIDSKAGRVSQYHLEVKIRDSNAVIEKLKADHAKGCHHLEKDVANERTRTFQLEKELSSSRDKLRELRTRYESSERSRRTMKDQLARREEEARNSRLDGVGNFDLSTSIIRESTQPSDDQLFNLLQNLNYEIFQTSALLADSASLIDRPLFSENTDGIDIIDDETTSLLGPRLLSLVRSQSHAPLDSYDPYPLQTAIQATLVCCATRVMTAWYPGYWEHSDFLAATYASIRDVEGISASDAWKAMTRARLRPTTGTIGRVVDFYEECLTTIFRYAGWPAVNVEASAGSSGTGSGETIESLLRENHEKLSSLARHSLRLNVMLDSVSPQLEPAFVEPGSVFDPYVMDRDDDSGAQRTEDNDEVISTSEIGLRKAIIDGMGGSSSRRRIVLKPKVILRSSIEA
jgi:chromosome segregation ATPase